MVESFDNLDRDELVAFEKIKEFIEKEQLPKITPEQAQRFLHESGKLKKKIEELISESIDPQTGAVDLSTNPETGKLRHSSEFNRDELKKLLDDAVAFGLQVEKSIKETETAVRNRIEPVKDLLAVDTSKKTKSGRAIPGGNILKQSIRRVFGENTDLITFDMYSKALELRTRLRQEDIGDALKDSPIGLGENIATATRRRKSEQSE